MGGAKKSPLAIIHPRENFSFGLVDISDYLSKKQTSLNLELEWTESHNLSFIGLTEVKPIKNGQSKIEKIRLAELKHSHNRNINKNNLKEGKVELIPGQFISLEFPYKKNTLKSNQRASFVLRSKGYYTQL